MRTKTSICDQRQIHTGRRIIQGTCDKENKGHESIQGITSTAKIFYMLNNYILITNMCVCVCERVQ